MALTAAELAAVECWDRMAYCLAACEQACNGGTDIWDRIINSADHDLIDAMIDDDASSNLDDEFDDLGPAFGLHTAQRTWTGYFNTYVREIGAADDIGDWLNDRNLRVDRRIADAIEQMYGSGSVALAEAHGPADAGASAPGRAFGSFIRGGALTAGTALQSNEGPSIVQGRVTTIGVADWTVSPECRVDDTPTTTVVAQVVDGTGAGGAVGDTYDFGLEQIGAAGAAAGQPLVPVAATGAFLEGQYVLMREHGGVAPNETWEELEICLVETIVLNTSLSMSTNLLHTYTGGAATSHVIPLFIAVDSCSDAGGTAADAITFYPGADRRLRL